MVSSYRKGMKRASVLRHIEFQGPQGMSNVTVKTVKSVNMSGKGFFTIVVIVCEFFLKHMKRGCGLFRHHGYFENGPSSATRTGI